MIWLRVKYVTGPETGTYGYIGPFDTHREALNHKRNFGPSSASVHTDWVRHHDAVTPEDHIKMERD